MKQIYIFLQLLILSAAFSVCGKPPEPGIPVTLDKVCSAEYNPFFDDKKRQVHRRLSFEGFPAFPRSVMVSSTVILDMYPSPDRQGSPVSVSFSVKASRNSVEKPGKGYTDKDLKITANDGTEVGFNTKIRVHGKRLGEANSGCVVTVDLIETVK